MAVRELGSSFEMLSGSYAAAAPLLKRHKVLPHPPHDPARPVPVSTPAPAANPLDLILDTSIPPQSSSSPSSPHTLKHTSRRVGAPVLPPTPPAHSRQSSGSSSSAASALGYEVPTTASPHMSSAPGTPTNQRSPPTPDVTPPRVKPLTLRPPPRSRATSTQSRTDSFKTALENPYSSDEDVPAVRPVMYPVTQTAPKGNHHPQRKNGRRKEIGLGLGLESDNEGTTTPRADTASLNDFVVFDGEWNQAGGEASEVEREWDDNLMRNVVVRKTHARKPYTFIDSPDGIIEDNIVSPTLATKIVRSLPLQERIARHRLEREAERASDRMVQPSAVPDFDSPISADVRRFSAMSGRSVTSAVIEAIVVDSPPERRQKLRRSKKQFGLRDLSDQSSAPSGPSSVVSNEPQRTVARKLPQIPDQRHRSLASNATVSTASSSGRSRRQVLKDGGIPVVVVPDRLSSRTSRAPSLRSTSSHRTKRTVSLSSAPISHSSKYNDPGYFESNPPHKRTASESEKSAHSVRTIDYPPHIPARRSSLSAPTSRNTSRAGSLTAESLKAHNLIHDRDIVKPEMVQVRPPELQQDIEPTLRLNIVDYTADPSFGNRRSTQVTPFSQSSYETAGTAAEVSEAMAVSIFPHQNRSLLLVQQLPAPQRPSAPMVEAIDHAQPQTVAQIQTAVAPVTPPQLPSAADDGDSPLRNPRAAPEPPAIKFIPPTPAALIPEDEQDREMEYDQRPSTSDTPRRRSSLMRRAFYNRRNSETAIEPVQGLLRRTFSLGSRRRALVNSTSKSGSKTLSTDPDRPADDTKLHPFWRPNHFWDDLDAHDDGIIDYQGRYAMINNRPSPPRRSLSGKLKRTFAILPVKDDYAYPSYADDKRTVLKRGDGPLQVVRQGDNFGFRRGPDGRLVFDPRAGTEEQRQPFGYGFPEGNGGKVHTIPGIGLRVEYPGWSEMRRKLSERKREQRSEKLRAIISNPKDVQNGTDDILRRRSDA